MVRRVLELRQHRDLRSAVSIIIRRGPTRSCRIRQPPCPRFRLTGSRGRYGSSRRSISPRIRRSRRSASSSPRITSIPGSGSSTKGSFANLQVFDGLFGADAAVARAKRSFDYDAPIEGLRAVDRYTLRVKLTHPAYSLRPTSRRRRPQPLRPRSDRRLRRREHVGDGKPGGHGSLPPSRNGVAARRSCSNPIPASGSNIFPRASIRRTGPRGGDEGQAPTADRTDRHQHRRGETFGCSIEKASSTTSRCRRISWPT